MLKIRNISKSFSLRGQVKIDVLSGLDLEIEKGKSLVLFGSNGSGKSTLLNIIRGDIFADTGDIFLFDSNITKYSDFKRSSIIYDIKQKSGENLCESLTLLETYLLSIQTNSSVIIKEKKKHKKELEQILSSYNLGLEKLINNQIKSLSGGEYQIFNMLLLQKKIENRNKPCLVLLDEHLAHLDPISASKVFSITEEICSKDDVTSIIVSHNINKSVKLADDVGILQNGKIKKLDIDASIEKKISDELKNGF